MPLISSRHIIACILASAFASLHLCAGITVAPTIQTNAADSPENATTYRVSLPQTKHSTNRVPAHLQDIQKGFVDDDADDVIHIIEPPAHFQQLKRRLHGSSMPELWQHPIPVRNQRPPADRQQPKRRPSLDPQPIPSQSPTKLTHNRGSSKYHHPESSLRLRNAHNQHSQRQHQNSSSDFDSQVSQSEIKAMQHLNFPVSLPMEIHASVRKTQRLMQQKRPLKPFAKQRKISKESHTVIMEKGYDEKHWQRGKEQRFGGEKTKQLRRSRRAVAYQPQSLQPQISESKITTNQFDAQRGTQILLHLNELLKNASYYVPDEWETTAQKNSNYQSNRYKLPLQFKEVPAVILTGEIAPTTASKSLPLLRTTAATTTTTTKTTPVESKETLSLKNATNMLMTELFLSAHDHSQTTLATTIKNVAVRCELHKPVAATASDHATYVANSNKRTQELHAAIECMRTQLAKKPIKTQAKTTTTTAAPSTSSATTTTTTTTVKPHSKRYGERLRQRKKQPTARPNQVTKQKTTNPTDTHNKGRFRSRTQNAIETRETKPASILAKTRNSRTLSGLLLYDDVMTNIRNMLQAQNLLDDLDEHSEGNRRAMAGGADATTTTPAVPRFLLQQSIDYNIDNSNAETNGDDDDDNGLTTATTAELNALNMYLHELRTIVANLPQQSLNVYEQSRQRLAAERGSTSSSSSSSSEAQNYSMNAWYLINGQGRIYETALQANEYQPNATLFHSFPDIPAVTNKDLNNRTILGQTAVEIL